MNYCGVMGLNRINIALTPPSVSAMVQFYALVICNHGPHGAGDSGGIAGLKYGDFTFGVSRQCRGMAGLLIPAKTTGEIAGRFVWVAMIRCFFYICQHFQTSGFVSSPEPKAHR